MTDPEPPRDWASIDSDPNAEDFIELLDQEAAHEPQIERKRQRHELLGVSPGDRVLDAGCGQGVDVRLLADSVGAQGEVVGVDVSETMLEAARERTENFANIRYEQADVTDLPFPDNSFDAVQADGVLAHTDAPEDAMYELTRVTRQGGRVGVTDHDLASNIIETPGGQSLSDLDPEYAVHKQPLIGRRLFRIAKAAGLTDIDVEVSAQHVPDFRAAEQAIMIGEWLDAMVSAGEITQQDADAWLEGCRQANEDGTFFGAGMPFTVVGTVPGRG